MTENPLKSYLAEAIENVNLETNEEYLAGTAEIFLVMASRKLVELGVMPEHVAGFLLASAHDVLEGDTDKLLKLSLEFHNPSDSQ